MKFIITSHPEKKDAEKIKLEIIQWLKDKNQEVVSDEEVADLVIVLGGDGFMMHSVDKFSPKGIPCFGINTGDVGFLTNGNVSDWENILEKIIKNEFKIDKRIGLELDYKNNKFGPYTNDIYLKHPTSMASFKIKLNNELIYEDLRGDGVVISTPTGSTGYSVSAGGPIIQPSISCLSLTPICSVHLNARSLMVSPDSVIEIEIIKIRGTEPVLLVADGKILDKLVVGEKIIVKQHTDKLLFAILDHHDFYRALQDKKGLMR